MMQNEAQKMTAYERGERDGFEGAPVASCNESYLEGFDAGTRRWEQECNDQIAAGAWNPVEQGMYDDDPSPYLGTYSEM